MVEDTNGSSDGLEEVSMHMSIHTISPLAALIAGILILLIPRILNYVVAIYLIVIGLIGVLGR
jgi:hypothetical protein